MRYCNRCILPDSRPGLVIGDNGVCNACNNSHSKSYVIDWKEREVEFKKLIENVKQKSKGYDCLIPVSGGKDSTWQVVKCLEAGLKPLCFTWRPPGRTKIGQDNLDNLISLGVDHIDYSISPETERKFLLKSLRRYGIAALPMHMAIFNIAPSLALKFNIPLIVWGENSAFEYGSEDDANNGFLMDESWFKKFGVTHGTTSEDWIDEELTSEDLTPYKKPDYQLMKDNDIRAVFLGYYFKWDPQETARIAIEHGFKTGEEVRVGLYNFADIDDYFISVHHFPKWHKFGFSRIFDNLSLEIRNGRISREEAIEILKSNGPEIPKDDINKYCSFVGITVKEFFEILEKFRNNSIWSKESDEWKIDNFLIKNWDWKKLYYED